MRRICATISTRQGKIWECVTGLAIPLPPIAGSALAATGSTYSSTGDTRSNLKAAAVSLKRGAVWLPFFFAIFNGRFQLRIEQPQSRLPLLCTVLAVTYF